MSLNRTTRVQGAVWGGIVASLAVLALTPVARAQVTVQTIGGGPRTQCGSASGFKSGNTWMAAQFNLPNATALDSSGDLWVADTGNSDVEEVTLAGNRTSSLTYEYAAGSNKHPFPGAIAVAVDSANDLYVMTSTMLFKFDNVTVSFPSLNPLFEISLSAFSSATPSALTVVNDATTTIYVAFTNSAGGTILRIPQPYNGTHTTVVNSYPFGPAGLSMRDDGQLAIADTRNSGIYLVGTNNSSTPVLLTGGSGPGFVNGAPSFAKFDQPHGIAASSDGRMVVCDTMNNMLRLIDTSNNTTTLYGTASNVWTTTQCAGSPILYAGWVDGTAGTTKTSASGRQPVSVTIAPNGTLFVTELFYSLIRSVTGSGLTPVTSINSGGSSTNIAKVTTLGPTGITASGGTMNGQVVPGGLSGTTVYFEWGSNTSYGSNTLSQVISTNINGTNLFSFTLTGLPLGTTIHYQAVANNNGQTNVGGDRTFITSTAGSGSSSNQIGFATSLQAGIGSTVYVPLVVQLQNGDTLNSLQFRVEVSPIPPNVTPIAGISLVQVTTNDFIQLIGPSPSGTPVNFTVTSYTNTVSTNGQGLLVFAGPGSGLSIQNSGAVGLLQIQVPYNAATNQTYSLNVLYPSGSVSNISAMNQILTIADIPYLAGDSSSATGYNAGEFGEGSLDNTDVINALYASVGIAVPPFDSDIYNAMDVYPQTPTHDGDGIITFQDWNQILLRSVGLDTNNWIRFWTNGGVRVGVQTNAGLPTHPFIPAAILAGGVPPGAVWYCQAEVRAGSVTNALPGSICSIPVYANVKPNFALSGFQFRTIVTPVGSGPAVGQVDFVPATGMITPLTFPGKSVNDTINAWELNSIPNPLQNTNYIGVIQFQIPANAQAGQGYVARFTAVEGAYDTTSEYTMESFPGYAWVQGGAPPPPPSITSDEWKLHFFASLSNSLGADNIDADGDGASNAQEYLAGTDPTSAASALRFDSSGCTTNGAHGLALSWVTAPGKTYVVESIPVMGGKSWTALGTNTGDGYSYQFIQNNISGTALFYRIRLQP